MYVVRRCNDQMDIEGRAEREKESGERETNKAAFDRRCLRAAVSKRANDVEEKTASNRSLFF